MTAPSIHDRRGAAACTEGDSPPESDATPESDAPPEGDRAPSVALRAGTATGDVAEELAERLPASELVKIIKNALECGRRNIPFTERELWQAAALGASSTPGAPSHGVRRR